MVQLYISQLRRALAGDAAEIRTHGRAYELRLASEAVDVERFEGLIDAATRGGARGAAREALVLWRGDALSDVVGEPFAAHAERYRASLGAPLPGSAWLLHTLGITKRRRTAYDHAMLRLHDRAKADA